MKENDKNFIGIIGAAGQTGIPILNRLIKKGTKVRAIIHKESQEDKLPKNIETAIADNRNKNSLLQAMKGLNTVYYIPPVFIEEEVKFGKNVLESAIETGCHRLVYHSVMHSKTPSMPHHWKKYQVEEFIRKSDIVWTIVQPSMYSQTPLSFMNHKNLKLKAGFDDKKIFTPIDLRDLAEAVSNILTEKGHEYKVYELAGKERLDLREMSQIIGKIVNKEIKIVRIPSLIVAIAAAYKLKSKEIFTIKAMLDYYNKNGFEGNSKDLIDILRHEPHTFYETMQYELKNKNFDRNY